MFARSRSFRASFFSAAAVVVVLLIVVCLNLILSRVNLRWDTTRQQVYSLSQGTHTILAELERDVTIKVFYSSSLANTPVSIRTHAGRLQDFLAEYELYSRGRVRVERYDPKMDSVAEKWAQTYGVQKLPLAGGEGLYFGLVALAGGQDDVIPFLEPARERQLEYDITRLITRVQSTRQPKIGVISGLPVFGETAALFAVPGQPPPAPPWFFISELRKTYAVTEIDPSAEGLVEALDLLLVVHPREVSDQLLYDMDQYLMRGGNLLLFVDPFAVADVVVGRSSAGTLQRFFRAWGVQMDDNRVLMDLNYPTRLRRSDNQVEQHPLWLTLTPAAINAEHFLTAQLESLLLPVAGGLSVPDQTDLAVEPLLRSSRQSALIPNFRVLAGVDDLRRDFEPADQPHDLALQLMGLFDSAFGEGPPPSQAQASSQWSDVDQNDRQAPLRPHLAKGQRTAVVVMVADADMLFDGYAVERQTTMGFDIARMFNDNINFLLNVCELLTGSDVLIGIRSRGSLERPFTRVRELELRAQTLWLEREQALVRQIEATNQTLERLEQQKDPSQKFIISPEQATEIDRFREERARISDELAVVRRNLRSEIDALEKQLTFANIFIMPMLVAMVGIGYALCRYRRQMKQ